MTSDALKRGKLYKKAFKHRYIYQQTHVPQLRVSLTFKAFLQLRIITEYLLPVSVRRMPSFTLFYTYLFACAWFLPQYDGKITCGYVLQEMIFGWNGENTPKFCVLRYMDYYTFNYIRNELCCKRDRVATFIYNIDCVDRLHSILDKTISIVLLRENIFMYKFTIRYYM